MDYLRSLSGNHQPTAALGCSPIVTISSLNGSPNWHDNGLRSNSDRLDTSINRHSRAPSKNDSMRSKEHATVSSLRCNSSLAKKSSDRDLLDTKATKTSTEKALVSKENNSSSTPSFKKLMIGSAAGMGVSIIVMACAISVSIFGIGAIIPAMAGLASMFATGAAAVTAIAATTTAGLAACFGWSMHQNRKGSEEKKQQPAP